MLEFYLKDKKTDEAIRGFLASTEINCPPLDFFRFEHAYNSAKQFQDILKIKCPIDIPDSLVRQFVLQETNEMIEEMLSQSEPHPAIHKLLSEDTLSHKEQVKLLKGVVLTPIDMLWLNKEAQDRGYLLDIYHEEKYPKKFNEKTHPMFFCLNNDVCIEKMGTTDMTEGEMRALLDQRKVVQARIYHKKNTWHCFYFTFKGLAGLECGLHGSKSHYHYLSNKSGIVLSNLVKRIKDCDMPSSKVHIMIVR